MPSEFIYLARGRPQRPRANLVQTLHTVEALGEVGVNVRLYVPRVPTGFDMPRFLGGMGIHAPIDIRPHWALVRKWGGWPFFLGHVPRLRQADVVYTRVPELSLGLARFGIRHFLEVHDTATLKRRNQLAHLSELSRTGILRGALAISDSARQTLIDAGFTADAVTTLPSGVDYAAFSAVPLPSREALCQPRAQYIGRISQDRGLSLFESIARAGTPVALVGPSDDIAARDIPNLDVHPAIDHARVPERLGQSEIALMPYQADLRHASDISPIKLFEAMAAGRVIIASDLPAIREVIRSGENGLLVPADDPTAWRAAIARIAEAPDTALAMAKQARSEASDYSWTRRAERLMAFVQARTEP